MLHMHFSGGIGLLLEFLCLVPIQSLSCLLDMHWPHDTSNLLIEKDDLCMGSPQCREKNAIPPRQRMTAHLFVVPESK